MDKCSCLGNSVLNLVDESFDILDMIKSAMIGIQFEKYVQIHDILNKVIVVLLVLGLVKASF